MPPCQPHPAGRDYAAQARTVRPRAAVASSTGCAGNTLAATSLPWLGATFRALATGLPANALAVDVFGVSSGSGGLGWFIYENKNQLEIPNVFAGLFTVIVIGLIVENVVFRVVETRTVRRWGLQS